MGTSLNDILGPLTMRTDEDWKTNEDHVMYSYRPSQIAVLDKEFGNLLRRNVGVDNVGFQEDRLGAILRLFMFRRNKYSK